MVYYWKNTCNKAIIIGIVIDDVKYWTTESGKKIATFTVMTELFWKDSHGKEKSFQEKHPIVVWGYMAELAKSIVKRGELVYIDGCIKSRFFDGNDGKKQVTEIMGEKIIVLSTLQKTEIANYDNSIIDEKIISKQQSDDSQTIQHGNKKILSLLDNI